MQSFKRDGYAEGNSENERANPSWLPKYRKFKILPQLVLRPYLEP